MRRTTREKILDIIRRREIVSAEELRNILGLTIGSIRHHLHILTNVSLIEIVDKKKGIPGRPINYYGLSNQMLANGREQLLMILLEEFVNQSGVLYQYKQIRELAARLADKLGRVDSVPRSQQFTTFVDKLMYLNYSPRWQASPVGPQIIFTRCPYKNLVNKFPQLCIYDRYIIEEYFNVQAALIEKIIPFQRESNHCLFQIIESQQP